MLIQFRRRFQIMGQNWQVDLTSIRSWLRSISSRQTPEIFRRKINLDFKFITGQNHESIFHQYDVKLTLIWGRRGSTGERGLKQPRLPVCEKNNEKRNKFLLLWVGSETATSPSLFQTPTQRSRNLLRFSLFPRNFSLLRQNGFYWMDRLWRIWIDRCLEIIHQLRRRPEADGKMRNLYAILPSVKGGGAQKYLLSIMIKIFSKV